MNRLKRALYLSILSILALTSFPSMSEELVVKISRNISSIKVIHNGQPITIQRNQNTKNTIADNYALTSRPCPRFCIQPIKLAPGVETVGELEVINYLQQIENGDKQLLVIDSRTPNWVKKGTIPGSISIPWTSLNVDSGADSISIGEILESQFGAIEVDNGWDFSKAKTLVLFCNGMWCGQSGNSIKALLKMGYPTDKLKWYRDGMQTWEALGLTTVK
jgi:rhodanese-related sulfurtransferase